jgi:predicted nuclease of predicted toxin-antitoxin system
VKSPLPHEGSGRYESVGDGSSILTNDLDFGIELVTKGLGKPGVIQLRSDDLRPSTMGGAVLAALEDYARELRLGVLITIDPKRSRFRLLQLGEDE